MRVCSFLDITPQLWFGCHLPVVLPCLELIILLLKKWSWCLSGKCQIPGYTQLSSFPMESKALTWADNHESTQDSVLETDLLLLRSHLLLTAKYSGDKTVKVNKRLNNIKKISCLVGWCGMYLPNYKYELSCIILQMHTLYNGRLNYASPKRFMS